jgi:hypothetical protein
MFYYKLSNGKIINLNNVVIISPLIANEGMKLTMADGTQINVLEDEWLDLDHLIDSYTYHKLK